MINICCAPEQAGGLALILPGHYYNIMKEAQGKIIKKERIDLFKLVRNQHMEKMWPQENKNTLNFGYCINSFSHLEDSELRDLCQLSQ